MANYVKYKLVGGIVKLKNDVMPHKFDCQKDIKEPIPKPAYEKRRRIEFYEKVLSKNIPVSSSTQEADFADCGRSEDILEDTPMDPIALPSDVCLGGVLNKKSKSIQVNMKPKTHDQSTNTTRQSGKHDKEKSPLKSCLLLDSSFTSSENSSAHETNVDDSVSSEESLKDSSLVSYKNHMKKGMLMSISREPKLLLGLPKESYFCIKLLSETIKTTDINIMITLKKIRLDQPYSLLAIHFGLSKSYVAKIVRKTLPLITSCMQDLIIFPLKKQIQSNLPIPFRSRYSNVQSIIDCFEVQIEKPTNAVQQALTWSSYKSCNTIKYLISITPDGLISYISEGYGGRTTDTCIFEDCGYLLKLSPGAVVLADRGFKNIAHLLEQRGCTLLRPPSVHSNVVPTKKEVQVTKMIAALRVHVERTIGRLREFGFLLPHACVDSQQINMLDYVVTTACGIINLQSTLFKST